LLSMANRTDRDRKVFAQVVISSVGQNIELKPRVNPKKPEF